MDVVKFWDDVVTGWKAEGKCGLCWKFDAPLIESQSNIVQADQDEECCVFALVTELSDSTTSRIASNTGFPTTPSQDNNFTIHFVMNDGLGTNNYTEILGHPKEESRYKTIYKPIKDCLESQDLYQLFCDYVGQNVIVTKWNKEVSHAYLDNNFYGWQIRATFRQEL